jgi:Tol biopolymer transport system component
LDRRRPDEGGSSDPRLCSYERLAGGAALIIVEAEGERGRTKTPVPLFRVVVALLLVGLLAGCGSHNGRRRAPGNRLSWKSDSPSWSPAGRKIVFVGGRCTPESAPCLPHTDLYTIKPDGTALHRLTRTRVDWDYGSPVWSPDGRHIAFDAEPASDVAIYVMDADGSKLRQLTPNGADDYEPSWSPDGRKIAFKQGVGDANGRIGVMNADGSGRRLLTPASDDDLAPAWSPDGRRIAFVRSTPNSDSFEIDVMDADGRHKHRLKAQVDTNNEPVTWSPDGQKIAFDNNFDIWVMDADGTNSHALGVKDGQAPAWSPDGKHIAFTTFRRDRGIDELYLMNADGTDQQVVIGG